eukprot:Amastigsp_a514324_96.p3 type:complete len:175 gc:universal Amastigsp_a514324_96:545-21(-)
MSRSGLRARISATLGMTSGIKAWPPKPGSTVITSTMSTRSRIPSKAATGVAGLSATPTRMPCSRTRAISDAASDVASMWNVNDDAPAAAKSAIQAPGSVTMRWQSRNAAGACARRDLITGGPMVRFATKCPSITSQCSQSAPAASTRSDSAPSVAKLAARSDGAMIERGMKREK